MERILVVVDMQNDFIAGVLGTKEAQGIVDNVCEKIRAFDGEILVTLDTHKTDYLNTQEGVHLPVEHCIKNTDGWRVLEMVQSALSEKEAAGYKVTYFEKPTFGSTDLASCLAKRNAEKNIGQVTLIGVCTDICVVSNAILLKAVLPEVELVVDAACCAGVTPEKHEAALETMRSCQIRVEGC